MCEFTSGGSSITVTSISGFHSCSYATSPSKYSTLCDHVYLSKSTICKRVMPKKSSW